MKKIILASLMLLMCGFAYAQNKISGKITDENKQPLAGASVFIQELNKGVISDGDGDYELTNLPAGKLTMEVSYIGYKTDWQKVTLLDGNFVQNVQLQQSLIEAPEVLVSGVFNATQHENAVKIDVMKTEAVQLSGTPNYMEALSQVPGVDMIAKGQGVAKPVIRGLSMNDVLVLNNGVRIENYQFSENHPLGIDGNSIEKVEVIKGPASLLYGSDAIGGVIDFIKERPAVAGTIVGDYNLKLHSNTKGFANNLGIKGASDKFFAGIRLGQKSNADYKQGGGDYVPNSRFNEKNLNVNVGYTSKLGTFKLYYDYFKQDLGMTVPPVKALITKRGRKNDYWYQDLTHQLVSSQNRLYFGNFKWDVNASFQSALRKLQTMLEEPFIEMQLNTLTYETKLHLPSDANSEYVVGAQGMSQRNSNLHDRASQFLPDAKVHNIGFLGLAKYGVSDKLSVQGGLRYDFYKTETFALGEAGTSSYHAPVDKDFSNLNGSIGATYRPDDKITFRLNFAKGYRVPNLSELTSNGMHGNRYEVGNADLSPENSFETDLSMHYHSDLFTFDIAGFYNHINDYIFISPTTETTTSGVNIYQFSQTDATLYGGELGVHLHPTYLPWLHVEGTFSSVIGKQKNNDYLPFIPAHKLRCEVRAEGKKWSIFKKPSMKISALTAFSQDNPSPYETASSGYTVFNAGANTEIEIFDKDVLLSLTVNNIFDKEYFDHLSTLKGMGYYNQGQNISLNISMPFDLLTK